MASTGFRAEEALDRHARALAEALQRAARMRANETELREDVHALVAAAVQELYDLDPLASSAERRAGKSARTFDRTYGGLVIEWEWRMDGARRRHGAEQALDYLAELRADLGVDDVFSAVVCDGRQFGFLVDDDPHGQLDLGEALRPELTADQRFEWRPVDRASCRRFLQLVGSNQKRPVTASALATEFGSGSETTRKAITLLVEQLAGRSPEDRSDTLFREWHRSLEVVYEDLTDADGALAEVLRREYGVLARRPLGELLYSVHTYFALVARLIAIEVLAVSIGDRDAEPSLWGSEPDGELIARLRAVDEGLVPASLRIDNLFEGDVFSWYLDVLDGNVELLDALRDVLTSIGTFAFPRLAFGANPAHDVLRDLYQRLLPRELRKALGEFLTPQWLAEACLERLGTCGAPIADGRVLDPTCGTGTFLMPVLAGRATRLRARSDPFTTDDVQRLLDSVVGFDLNPVAVIAARVNVVITLGDLVNVGNLTLPIWRADSILVPDVRTVQGEFGDASDRLKGREWMALETSLKDPFPIPPALANAAAMPVLRRLLEDAVQDDDSALALDNFQAALDAELGPGSANEAAPSGQAWDDVRAVALELCDRIRALRDAGRDGVWAGIIENSFAPLFAGRFDVVVGNPPWLAWNKMPESWRTAGMRHWKRYGLWRPPAEGGRRVSRPQIGDVATLVYATAVARYADEHAYVGLLVPTSLLIGDPSGRAFRKFRLAADRDDVHEVGYGPRRSFKPLYADLWGPVAPFAPDAANKPAFLVAQVDAQRTWPVPTTSWRRKLRQRVTSSWATTRPLLDQTIGASWPVNRSYDTSQWSFVPAGMTILHGGENVWTFGLGFNTRGANGVYFGELRSSRPGADGLVTFANDNHAGRNDAVRQRPGDVEAELVYPVLRGREVRRWVAEPTGYVFAPYRQDAMGKGLSNSEFRRAFPKGYRWLSAFRPLLRVRKIMATLNWDLDGDDWCQIMGMEHMDGRPCVVVREMMRRPAAAVVETAYDPKLGRSATTLIDHKLLFCRVPTADEAHYLAATINSTPMQDLLATFLNEVGVAPATLKRLPIPPYRPADTVKLVAAARAAAAAAASGDADGLAAAERTVDEQVRALLAEAAQDPAADPAVAAATAAVAAAHPAEPPPVAAPAEEQNQLRFG